jgi:hypothetical protein
MNFTRRSLSRVCLKKADNKIFLIFFSILLLLSACDKQEDFDLKTTPPGESFDVSADTVELKLSTEPQEAIKSSNLSHDLAGQFHDPELGITKATLHAQFRLEQFDVKFGPAPKVDSAVLYLRYSGAADFTGKPSSVQTWKVYELQDKLENKDYYSNSAILLQSTVIGSFTGAFNPADSLLRINIDKAFANKILTLDAGFFKDNNSFLEQIKGLAIVPENASLAEGEGALIYFQLRDSKSRLSIYYNDSSKFNLVVNSESVRVNTFSHDYTGKPAQTQLSNKDTATIFDKVYLQAAGGLKVKVEIPGLADIAKNKDIALHQAKIIFPKYENDPSGYAAPPVALLYPRNEKGENDFTNKEFNQEFNDNLLPGYGGKWNNNEKNYSFIVTGHVQNLLARYKKDPNYSNRDYGMNLFVPADNPLSVQRVILANRSTVGGARPKLILIFTKLN